MKTRNYFEIADTDKPAPVGKKPKSLRPMRSIVAVRSMKSKTLATGVVVADKAIVAPKKLS